MATDVAKQDLLAAEKPQTLARRVWHQTRNSPWFLIGATMTLLLISTAFLWPEISEISPTKINIRQRFLPPVFMEGGNWTHPLGTDQLGRDIFIRCLIGLKTSLTVAVFAVVFMFFIGCAVGLWSGFKSGWTDVVLMRLTDVQLSIPAIVMAIAIIGVARPSIPNIVLVLALAGWPIYARVARSIAL